MVGGASGNMLLGALIDAGASEERILEALRTIPVPPWSFERRRADKSGISATYVDFVIPGEDGHPGEPAHRHMHLADVLGIIDASGLTAGQKQRASSVYRRLAEAEARVHGTTAEEIHFHEVGQVDAILDVAGFCVALDLLGVSEMHCSAVPLGRGMVKMQHGTFPNPPPATAELIKGMPTFDLGVEGETVTPTAAAILAALCSEVGRRPAMTAHAVGYGAGKRDSGVPNVTRVFVGSVSPEPDGAYLVLEANIDDMVPQFFELVSQRLFEAGALDVWTTPIQMKKGRPAVLLSALAPERSAEQVAQAFLRETTTLGVRMHRVERRVLERTMESIESPYGPVRVKRTADDRYSLEYDDLRRIAEERRLPLPQISRALYEFIGRGNA